MSKGTVNKVIIMGKLGKDVELRHTQSGSAVANISVATNHGVKDAQGNWSDQTEWHSVVLFGKTAENAAQYLSKGSGVYIEGRLQTRKWQDQSGNDRYSTEVVANEMQFIGGNQQQNYQQAAPQPQAAPQQQWGNQPQQAQPMPQQQGQQQQWGNP